MKHHLNRRIVLNADSKFKSLYTWSLREMDAEGAIIDRDLIPWAWRLYFTATELSYHDDLTIKPEYRSSEEETPVASRNSRRIDAKLRPGTPHDWSGNRQTRYSMFGTDRTITAFWLSIEPLADGEEEDRCWAWGSVSFSSGDGFRDVTTDDTVTFHVFVRPETFEHYMRTVRAAEVDAVVLYVQRVAGFYSEWSPDVLTDSIKVLTEYKKDHPIEVPEGSEIVPPRLGEVGEVSLSFVRNLSLKHSLPEPDENDDLLDEDNFEAAPPDKVLVDAQHNAKANAQIVGLLTSLRAASWAIVALLLIILMT